MTLLRIIYLVASMMTQNMTLLRIISVRSMMNTPAAMPDLTYFLLLVLSHISASGINSYTTTINITPDTNARQHGLEQDF